MEFFYEFWTDCGGRWRGHFKRIRNGKTIWHTPKQGKYSPSEIGPSLYGTQAIEALKAAVEFTKEK